MNALPVGPHQIADPEKLRQYFEGVERWHFDIACGVYQAYPEDEVLGPFRQIYAHFVEETRKRGLPACIEIQPSIAPLESVAISAAQYNSQNVPERWKDKGFLASFASTEWREYLKRLIAFFIEQCGYDWITFGEAIYRVDIPGTSDHFYQVFRERYPHLEYPSRREESKSYLAVQTLKADILIEFFRELTSYSKEVGAKQVGVMPCSFIPSVENSPEGTLYTSCDTGRIAALEHLDFLMVRMQPRDVFAGVMRTGDAMQNSPLLYYPEVLAHSVGKPVIAAASPWGEDTRHQGGPLVPLDYFKRSLLAALAASPNGFASDWPFSSKYNQAIQHMEFMAEINRIITRLGRPVSPIAFVFSCAGGRHAEPETYERAWQHYWVLARKLLFEQHRPMLTIYADTLADDLARHPEVQVLVFDEHFPLTPAQVATIRRWWHERPDRALVVFAGGSGYSADINKSGEQPTNEAFPGLLDALGVKEEAEVRSREEAELALRYAARVKRSAFLGDTAGITVLRLRPLSRIFGAGATVLYTDNKDEPVIVEMSRRGSVGLVCGIQLSQMAAELAAKAIRYALGMVDAPDPAILSTSEGVLWSNTHAGFLVIANTSTEPGWAQTDMTNWFLWDVVQQRELEAGMLKIDLPPLSFRLFRRFPRRAKLFDIEGAMWIESVVDGSGRADISMMCGRETSFRVKSPPKEILVDGEYSQISLEREEGVCKITLLQCPPGKHEIVLKW